MNICDVKNIMIIIVIFIISIFIYDYLILRKRENFTIDEEGAKKLGIYNAIKILQDIEDKDTLNIKNLNVTGNTNINGNLDVKNKVKGKKLDVTGNTNISGNLDVKNRVKGKYFKLDGSQISHKEAKGDGCFYRSEGQVHIGCDDWIYFRDNNRNRRMRFGVYNNMIEDNNKKKFIKHDDKIYLTVKDTGNHEKYSGKYLGFCGYGACNKVNAGLQKEKRRGRLKILRE